MAEDHDRAIGFGKDAPTVGQVGVDINAAKLVRGARLSDDQRTRRVVALEWQSKLIEQAEEGGLVLACRAVAENHEMQGTVEVIEPGAARVWRQRDRALVERVSAVRPQEVIEALIAPRGVRSLA